jgi:KaiC domain protein
MSDDDDWFERVLGRTAGDDDPDEESGAPAAPDDRDDGPAVDGADGGVGPGAESGAADDSTAGDDDEVEETARERGWTDGDAGEGTDPDTADARNGRGSRNGDVFDSSTPAVDGPRGRDAPGGVDGVDVGADGEDADATPTPFEGLHGEGQGRGSGVPDGHDGADFDEGDGARGLEDAFGRADPTDDAGADGSTPAPFEGAGGDDGSEFGGDVDDALGGGGADGGVGGFDADDEFGGMAGSDGGPADPGPFEEDFESAFDDADVPGEGGTSGDAIGEFGGLGDNVDDDFGFGFEGDSGFDEDEFDSDIERIQMGIEGLDEMVLGGVPRRSLIAAIGSAGTGKTTFALEFVHRALVEDRRAVYITLEESRERIVNTADEKGWDFSTHLAEDRLAIVDLDPVEMANSLQSIRNELPRLVDEFGADRLALDSVSLLEMMYDHPAERRSEVFDFARSLKQAGVTIMVTSEASEGDAYTSRYGLVEYLADAVFVLQYVRPSDFRETRLAVEIQKIRDANHSRETKPYEITNDGISVYRQANIF